MSDNWIIALGLIVPGVATGFGAMPALFMKDVSRKWLDAMLGFAAGVMLSATGFSLILPSIEYGGGGLVAVLVTAAGVRRLACCARRSATGASHSRAFRPGKDAGQDKRLRHSVSQKPCLHMGVARHAPDRGTVPRRSPMPCRHSG